MDVTVLNVTHCLLDLYWEGEVLECSDFKKAKLSAQEAKVTS